MSPNGTRHQETKPKGYSHFHCYFNVVPHQSMISSLGDDLALKFKEYRALIAFASPGNVLLAVARKLEPGAGSPVTEQSSISLEACTNNCHVYRCTTQPDARICWPCSKT